MGRAKEDEKLKPVTLAEWKIYRELFDEFSGHIEQMILLMDEHGTDSIEVEFRPSLQRAVEAISRFSPKLAEARIRLAKRPKPA